MEVEVLQIAKWMNKEIVSNEHKGDWRLFTNMPNIVSELEWHKAKLLFAVKNSEKELIKEYIADCCNCLMFIANSTGVLNEETAKDANEGKPIEG